MIEDKKEEPLPEQNSEEIDEFVYDSYISWGEAIQAVFSALSAIDAYDLGIASAQDRARIKRIRRRGLVLLDMGISEIYNEKMEEYELNNEGKPINNEEEND